MFSINTQAELDLLNDQIFRQFEKTGLVISAMPGGYGLPPVAFTTGGAATGHPDLIMYGIAPGLAVPSLENAFSVVKERWPFVSAKAPPSDALA